MASRATESEIRKTKKSPLKNQFKVTDIFINKLVFSILSEILQAKCYVKVKKIR